MALGNTAKKKPFKSYFSSYLKLLVSLILYHVSDKSEKHVTERNESLNFWSLLINWGTQFLILVDWIIENDLYQTLCMVPDIFCQAEVVWIVFQSQKSCPNLVK